MVTQGSDDHIGHRIIRDIREDKALTKPSQVRLGEDEKRQLADINESGRAFMASIDDIAEQEMRSFDFSALNDAVYSHEPQRHSITGNIMDVNADAAPFDGLKYFDGMSYRDPDITPVSGLNPPYFEGKRKSSLNAVLAAIDLHGSEQRFGMMGVVIDEALGVLTGAIRSRSGIESFDIDSTQYRQLNDARKAIRDDSPGAEEVPLGLASIVVYATTKYGVNFDAQKERLDPLYHKAYAREPIELHK